MIAQDIFGLDLTLGDAAAAAPWNGAMLGFLSHGASTPGHLADALRLDPDFALAQTCRGLFCLMLGRREMHAAAADAARIAGASLAARGATPRERLYLAALERWLDGQPSAAAAAMDDVLAIWPQDALAMKIGQGVRFMLGDQSGMRRAIERVLPRAGADNPGIGYYHGCHAFTLEEAGDYAGAERAGMRALDLAPDDAWGLHAVAHIYDMTARPDDGVAFVEANAAAWAHCNNFRYHVWWHLALLHLDRGDADRALALYDAEVRRDRTDDYRDISNATSLLMRLELEGVGVGDRWEELAGLCAARVDDGCLAFADLHYMLALCGGGRDAAARDLIRRMHVDALHNIGEMDCVMRHPGLSVAKGLQAFTEGRHKAAFAALGSARGALLAIGGSHAQRDVFERVTIEAAIRSGALAEARALIDDRSSRRGAWDGFGTSRARLVADLIDGATEPALDRLA